MQVSLLFNHRALVEIARREACRIASNGTIAFGGAATASLSLSRPPAQVDAPRVTASDHALAEQVVGVGVPPIAVPNAGEWTR